MSGLVRLLLLALILAFSPAHAAAETFTRLSTGGAGGWLNVDRPLMENDMKGRLVLLDFWTYGCINCMQVIPDLEALEEKFGDKLLIIGVHSAKFHGEQGSDRILAAAKRFGLRHPVINDSDFAIWKSFSVKAWPTFILLDGAGQEISRYSGEGHRQDLDRDISAAIHKVTANSPLPAISVQDDGKAPLWFPSSIVRGNSGETADQYFITDTGRNRVVAINMTGQILYTIGGSKAGLKDGGFEDAAFNKPRGIEAIGNRLIVADTGNHALREVDLVNRTVRTVAGTGVRGFDRDVDGEKATDTALASPWDVAFIENAMQMRLVVAMAGLHQLWVYDATKGTVSVAAGNGYERLKDGPVKNAELAQPSSVAADTNSVYFLDAESSALRVLENGEVKTLIGTGLFDFGLKDGKYPEARLQHPQGLAVRNGKVYIADTYNKAIRVYDRATGQLSTLALSGEALTEPGDLILTDEGALVVDTGSHSLKKLNLQTGVLTPFELKPMSR